LINDSNLPLSSAIENFIQEKLRDIPGTTSSEVFENAELIILDGCDEAATIDGRFASDLFDLVNKKLTTPLRSNLDQNAIDAIVDLSGESIRLSISEGKHELELVRSIPDFEAKAISNALSSSRYNREINELFERSRAQKRFLLACRPNIRLGSNSNVER